jgi:glutamyl-tRNA(Gln) amidotransferase subunit D
MMKKISILHLGGTVASFYDEKKGGVSSKYTAEDILNLYPEIKLIAKLSSRLIKNMWSQDMNFKHYNIIAKEIEKEVKKGTEGIIITHGTDTMHYTSAALAFILEDLPIPVILTGAQRSSDRSSSDAKLNLICSSQFIANSNFQGVAICMYSSTSDDACLILPPTKTRKIHSTRRDAFKAINTKPIARVTIEGSVGFIGKHNKSSEKKLKLKLIKENLKIGILKAHPNMFAEQILFYKNYDGLIIESMGLGNLPTTKLDEETKENEKILGALKEVTKKIPIILTLQTIFGRLNMNIYSNQRIYQEIGLLGHQSDTLTETAFIKLAWLLSNYEKDEIPKLVSKNFRGEISSRTSLDFLDYVYS